MLVLPLIVERAEDLRMFEDCIGKSDGFIKPNGANEEWQRLRQGNEINSDPAGHGNRQAEEKCQNGATEDPRG